MSVNFAELLPEAEKAVSTARLNRLASIATTEFVKSHPGLNAGDLYSGIFSSWQEIANGIMSAENRSMATFHAQNTPIRDTEVGSQGFLHTPYELLPELSQRLFSIIDRVVSPEGKIDSAIKSREDFIAFIGNIESLMTILHLPVDGCGRMGEDFLRGIIDRQHRYHLSPISTNGYRYDRRVEKKMELEQMYKSRFARIVSRSEYDIEYDEKGRLPMEDAIMKYANSADILQDIRPEGGFVDPHIPYTLLSRDLFAVMLDLINENPGKPLWPDFNEKWQELYKYDSEYLPSVNTPEVTPSDRLVGWVKFWLPKIVSNELSGVYELISRGNDILLTALSNADASYKVPVIDFANLWLEPQLLMAELGFHPDERLSSICQDVTHEIRILMDKGDIHDRDRLRNWKNDFKAMSRFVAS